MTPKAYHAGTHRTRVPGETVDAMWPLRARFGITRLADVTGLDAIGLPVWMAVRPNSRGISVSQGKGADRDAARASALMEAIECWHGEHIELPLRHESPAALAAASEVVLDVEALPLTAGAVLQPERPMLFVSGRDLVAGAPVWVPFELVTTNFVSATRADTTFFRSTNGLASGNHLLEAICHGLCEVIERDALALWSVETPARQKRRQLDLATVDDPLCRAALDRLAERGLRAAAWDLTSDIDVPAYACTILEEHPPPRWRQMGMFSGYGSHLSPGVALYRAIGEAVQSRLTMIAGSRDDLTYDEYRRVTNAEDRATLLAALDDPPPAGDFRARRDRSGESFEADLATMLAALGAAGVAHPAVVDLTRADLGIPVVKVVAPGLEGLALTPTYVPGARARAHRSAA